MVNLNAQMANVVGLEPDYLTVLMGGNDICTPTEAQMTSVEAFRTQLQAAMATSEQAARDERLCRQHPAVMGLYELFRGNWWARFIWGIAGICQSLLANPTSTAQADVDRRARVAARNRPSTRCSQRSAPPRRDAVGRLGRVQQRPSPHPTSPATTSIHRWPARRSSPPSRGRTGTAGPRRHRRTSRRSASFTASCSDLTCTFDDTSTDGDGTIASRRGRSAARPILRHTRSRRPERTR